MFLFILSVYCLVSIYFLVLITIQTISFRFTILELSSELTWRQAVVFLANDVVALFHLLVLRSLDTAQVLMIHVAPW